MASSSLLLTTVSPSVLPFKTYVNKKNLFITHMGGIMGFSFKDTF